MAFWVRFLAGDEIGFGTLADGMIAAHRGDMLGEHSPTGSKHALSSVRLLAPCTPTKLIGLWNNFHERAKLEGLQAPEHPLYFVKTPNCYAGEGDRIPRPAGYSGSVVFEGELGVVLASDARGSRRSKPPITSLVTPVSMTSPPVIY